jgi:hypothetical protein
VIWILATAKDHPLLSIEDRHEMLMLRCQRIWEGK